MSPTGTSARPQGEALGEAVISAPGATKPSEVVAARGASAEHRAGVSPAGGWESSVGVAHRRRGDHPALQHQVRTHGEEPRLVEHEVGELADLHGADLGVMPCATAGRSCTWRRSGGRGGCRPAPSQRTAARLIACAVCQVGRTSPIGPSPGSPSRSSRSLRGRGARPRRRSSRADPLSANARSSGTAGLRWWQTMSMSRCSSIVFTVWGRVGFVEEGSTFGSPATVMMSGAWPPPPPRCDRRGSSDHR